MKHLSFASPKFFFSKSAYPSPGLPLSRWKATEHGARVNDPTTPPIDPQAPEPSEYTKTLGQLYEKHRRDLVRIARKWSPPHDAHDVVNAVIRALIARPRHIGHFVRFFSGASRKVAKDSRLKERTRQRVESEFAGVPIEELLQAPSAEDCASMTQQLEAQLQILCDQAPQAVRAFELVRIHGLTIKEAARQMGLSPDQVSRSVRRVRDALEAVYEKRDIETTTAAASSARRAAAKPRRRTKKLTIPAVILAILAALVPTKTVLELQLDPATILAYIEAPHDITLDDGSVISLAGGTQFKIDLGPSERNVRLTSGQAEFDVARDPRRPFNVITSTVQVAAIGTRFSVHRSARHTEISVTEGAVRVSPLLDDGRPAGAFATLSAGQHLVIPDDRSSAPSAEVRQAPGWLRFDDASIGDIVAVFNRDYGQQIVIDPPDIAARRAGFLTIRTNRPESLLKLLDSRQDIAVVRGANGEVIVTSEP